jgi:predicted ATP-dependent serine protease
LRGRLGGERYSSNRSLAGHDIFVNVAGGVRLDEPATDLGAIVVVASSLLGRAVDPRTLIVGEVGLAGEVRAIGQTETRVREAAKLGFHRCIVPESSRRQLPAIPGVEEPLLDEHGQIVRVGFARMAILQCCGRRRSPCRVTRSSR